MSYTRRHAVSFGWWTQKNNQVCFGRRLNFGAIDWTVHMAIDNHVRAEHLVHSTLDFPDLAPLVGKFRDEVQSIRWRLTLLDFDLLTRILAVCVLAPIQYLAHIKDSLYESRYKLYIFIAPYKILLFVTGCVMLSRNGFADFFSHFAAGFGNHTIRIEEVKPILSDKLPDFSEITSDLFSGDIFANVNAIWWVLLTHVASSYICYIFGKFACKIHIQTFSFSLPINLTVPLTICILIILCGLREANICVYHDILPDYMFFHMPPVHFMFSYIFKQFAWIWVFWLLSQSWVTRHLWNPRNLRNASTERLFVLPMYDGLIIDQSMAFNRRREEFGEFIACSVSCQRGNWKIFGKIYFLRRQEKETITDPESLNEIDAKVFANKSNKEDVSGMST